MLWHLHTMPCPTQQCTNCISLCLVTRLKYLVITGWGCPSIIVVSPSQKDSWAQQQYELVQAVNKQALKSIQQSMQKSTERLNQKLL